ncbi:MAG TPA: Asd/ArgC dimerization domain-containing protein [Candidatus Sulfopaludibacter sp.]|nr:Asd/ArgC dimerization domain-containing protein [Candidatus Sulfopaludibacter sp.]
MAETVVVVGSETLLGREIRDIVASGPAAFELRLIAADEEVAGRLTRVGDEPLTVTPLAAENLADARAIVLAASAEAGRKALEMAAGAGFSGGIADLSYAAEEHPNARLRAPQVEAQAEMEAEHDGGTIQVIAHPAAIALALFLRRLQALEPIRRSVVQIFAPASEHGARGVEELQNQTISLLSFKTLPHAVFDTQLSFNLLSKYGEEAPASLEESELRIERHLASLLALEGEGEGAPMPSLRLVQAPVFHGYSFSAWVEFDSDFEVEPLEGSLASANIEVRGGEFEPPNNVSQAGQSGITVGGIMPDRNAAQACWFWVVADNFRVAAENAMAVVREMV